MQFLSEHFGCEGWRGEMSARIRAFDWSLTELGPLQHWPTSLRMAVQFLLASPVPLVMLWGRHGYMIYNDAYSVFAGGRHPYLLGSPVELGWPEVADFNRNVVDTCLAGGTLSYRNKELVLLRNGVPEDVWMDLYYSPVPGDDGSPAGVMAIVVETSAHVLSERAREQAEAAFRTTNERLQMALNTGAVLGSFVWDVQLDFLSGDERFARTFAYPAPYDLNRLPSGIAMQRVHEDDRGRVRALIDEAVRGGGPYTAEYRVRHGQGEQYRWVLASGRCDYDDQGRPLRFPGVLIDIHERKVAESALVQLTRDLEQRVEQEVRARSEAEERLRQSQKLEAIGGLTGGVAHDFNNVLQVIAGNLHLLARQQRDNPGVQQRVAAAITAVERGAKLSSQLLAFARRQQLSPAVYNLRRLSDGLGELLARALGETVRVSMQVPDQPWCIHVDRNQLENAVLNLVINARDAMNGEGVIAISADNLVLGAEFCAGKEIQPGDYVRLSVRDHGVGMAPATLAKAFEPFFTTKPDGHGTGLGLSMVFGFVKQSAGYVDILSTEGQGTTVQMYFPRSKAAEAQEEPAPPPRLLQGEETILVVEDDDQVRITAAELLEQSGYRVVTAENGDVAMRFLLDGLRVDLIFTDVVMPGQVKSADLAAWAQARTPPLPVLFASGHTRDIISRNNQLAPHQHLLRKPYSPDALTAMVRQVLQAST